MLFNTNDYLFLESDKERNLYFKILGGCVFNELIPDNKLGRIFIDKLISKYKCTCNEFRTNISEDVVEKLHNFNLDFDSLHVSFDYYAYKAEESSSDKGELADIFISGSRPGFIAIEAKFKEDYIFNKDIVLNGNRIYEISELKSCFGAQVLLITNNKWLNSKRKSNQSGSNYNLLEEYITNEVNKIPFILLLWEDVLEVISKDKRMKKVCRFLSDMLDFKR